MFDLKKHSAHGVAALLFATLLLAGCGNLTSGATGADVNGTPNTSAPTMTTGPVTIATDHSVYNGADIMNVTISSDLAAIIYAYDTQASCSILRLEVQQSGQWVDSNALPCPLGRVALPVRIMPGSTYSTKVGGLIRPGPNRTLADGTYRLVLRYFTSSPGTEKTPVLTEVDSATLTINNSIAPNSTPVPTGTTSTGGGVIPTGPAPTTQP